MRVLMGMAINDTKPITLLQLPIPLVPFAKFLRPYLPMCCILMAISSKLVKKENKGANGNAKAKKAMKPV